MSAPDTLHFAPLLLIAGMKGAFVLFPLLLAMATATAASPSAAATAISNAKPLREVIYKVSYTRRESLSIEHFGSVPPDAWGHETGDHGTVTVDVMAVGKQTLGIRLTESWVEAPKTVTYLGNVAPDGTANFGDQPLSDASRDLLPFFGPLFANAQQLAPGVSWVSTFKSAAINVTTTYSVGKIDGPVVTIEETQQLAVTSAFGMNANLDGWVTYKPSKLVPLAGQLTNLQRRSTATRDDSIQTIIDFERIKDTLDP